MMRMNGEELDEKLRSALAVREGIPTALKMHLEETYDKILEQEPLRRVRFRSRGYSRKMIKVMAVAAVLLIFGIGSVYAFVRLSGAGLVTEENADAVSRPEIAYAVTEAADALPSEAASGEYADNPILSREYLQSMDPDGLLRGAEITDIAVSGDGNGRWEIPKAYFHNGDMVILTKAGDEGWELEEGQKLRIRMEITEGNGKSGEGSHVQIGFIKNGRCEEILVGTKEKYDISLTADELGTYYYYVRNCSAGRLVFGGEICVEEEGEE